MAKKDLLKELKGGVASVTLVGNAVVREGGLAGVQLKDGKKWKHVNSSFGVKTGDGNTVFARIWGGYSIDKKVLKRWDNENNLVDIKWDDRLNEDKVESIRPSELFKAALTRDEENKPVTKSFISEIDFEEYLREHLADGMQIRVHAEAEYSEYNDDTQRRYNIKGVYLSETYTKPDGTVVEHTPDAKIKQTYLLDDSSLDRNWERSLEKNGSIIIKAFVPQYVSKIKSGDKYVELKQTVPYLQTIVLKMKDKEDAAELASKKKIIEKFFKVKKGTVREIVLINKINEGYEEATGVEVNDEMRELIEMGVFTEADIQKQVTIRGNKVSELIFSQPAVNRNKESGVVELQINDDKYAPEALIMPTIDGEDDEDGSFDSDDSDSSEVISEDEFTTLFG